MKFEQLKVNFEIPEIIQHDIDGLQEEIERNGTCVDCWQDEIRGSCLMCQGHSISYEQAELLINYYCRRRW